MLVIVVPTIVATLVMAWWFRSANTRATYRPLWEFSGKIEIVVWLIPAMVVLLLGGVAWVGSHDLDPARPIASTSPTVEVEVVALDWKWLFIYPGQGIATVNRLVVPTGSPVALKLTSATVMNSFFVPQLGSQIYAMPGMATRLHLLASRPGQYAGLSAQFSGDGFSGMRFVLESVTKEEFLGLGRHDQGKQPRTRRNSAMLSSPLQSKYVAPTTYGAVEPGLFQSIVTMKPSALAVCRPSRDNLAWGNESGSKGSVKCSASST
jgi:cytochrome o ubiquinol oxidase subunit 2